MLWPRSDWVVHAGNDSPFGKHVLCDSLLGNWPSWRAGGIPQIRIMGDLFHRLGYQQNESGQIPANRVYALKTESAGLLMNRRNNYALREGNNDAFPSTAGKFGW